MNLTQRIFEQALCLIVLKKSGRLFPAVLVYQSIYLRDWKEAVCAEDDKLFSTLALTVLNNGYILLAVKGQEC